MLKEAIQGLKIDPDGVYVDVTFGGGGHSRAILQNLSAEENYLHSIRIKLLKKISSQMIDSI